MKLIFAVDNNWNIGYDGDMLFKISKDLQRFRSITEENIIIMGRKTFESLPDRKALPNRINIVVTRDKEYKAVYVLVVNSIDELFVLLKKINPDEEKLIFLIGGGNLTHQMLEYATFAYITKVNKAFESSDTLIPNLDKDDNWDIVNESERDYQDDLEYKYVDYTRVKEFKET